MQELPCLDMNHIVLKKILGKLHHKSLNGLKSELFAEQPGLKSERQGLTARFKI